ncbi:MAG: hypothetical protein NY202_00595 [Mollicutes bacterium UO1]
MLHTQLLNTPKALYFVKLARELAKKNNLKLKLRWIKGIENPADYYSR